MLNMAGCYCQIVWVVVLKEQFLGPGISCPTHIDLSMLFGLSDEIISWCLITCGIENTLFLR